MDLNIDALTIDGGSMGSPIDLTRKAAVPHLPAVSFPLLLVAGAVWLLEHQRRTAAAAAAGEASAAQPVTKYLVQLLCKLKPELIGLTLLAVYIFVALTIGGTNNPEVLQKDKHEELWAAMQARWPLLSTPDTFVALQAMMRVELFGAATFRGAEASPLLREPLYLFLIAAAMRVAMLALSPADGYTLDGPLGGSANLAFEAAALGLLAFLAARTLTKRRSGFGLTPVFVPAVILAGWVAWNNHLGLGGPERVYLDLLNSFSECVELLAAMAFLARTIHGVATAGSGDGVFNNFVHMLLPLQQLCPVCFHLMAWHTRPLEEAPDIVGAGRPLLVLQLGGAAQVGLYILAATWHFSLGPAVAVKEDPLMSA